MGRMGEMAPVPVFTGTSFHRGDGDGRCEQGEQELAIVIPTNAGIHEGSSLVIHRAGHE
jgi:hypothetical protein